MTQTGATRNTKPDYRRGPDPQIPNTESPDTPVPGAGSSCSTAASIFEAHEVWEELWMECPAAERRFFQALIQAAVAALPLRAGQPRRRARLFRSGRTYMEPSARPTWGWPWMSSGGRWRHTSPALWRGGPAPPADRPPIDRPRTRNRRPVDERRAPPGDFSGTARLFPLPNLVLFPHVVQGLHVFEPRYRQLVKDALAGDRLIAIVLLKPGWEDDYDGRRRSSRSRASARSSWHEKLPDGRYNLRLRGLARVASSRKMPTRPALPRRPGRDDPETSRPRDPTEHAKLRRDLADGGAAAVRGGRPGPAATPGTVRRRHAAGPGVRRARLRPPAAGRGEAGAARRAARRPPGRGDRRRLRASAARPTAIPAAVQPQLVGSGQWAVVSSGTMRRLSHTASCR